MEENNLFKKNETVPKMEDVLSNTELARVLNSLTYTVAQRLDYAFEIAQMSELKNKSIFVSRLLKGLSGFESSYHLGEYDYKINTDHIERRSEKIKLPKKSRWAILKKN